MRHSLLLSPMSLQLSASNRRRRANTAHCKRLAAVREDGERPRIPEEELDALRTAEVKKHGGARYHPYLVLYAKDYATYCHLRDMRWRRAERIECKRIVTQSAADVERSVVINRLRCERLAKQSAAASESPPTMSRQRPDTDNVPWRRPLRSISVEELTAIASDLSDHDISVAQELTAIANDNTTCLMANPSPPSSWTK